MGTAGSSALPPPPPPPPRGPWDGALCSRAGRTGWVCTAAAVTVLKFPRLAQHCPPLPSSLHSSELRLDAVSPLGLRCHQSLQRAAVQHTALGSVGTSRVRGFLRPASPPGCAQALTAHHCRLFAQPGVVRWQLSVPQGWCCSSGGFQHCRCDLGLAAVPMENRGQRRRAGMVFSVTRVAGTARGPQCERRR